MLPDDFATNPRYASFALRATLATMGCYLLMVTTHWYGIHTCMVTTVATALATTGAQVHKQALRISGAILGGALGIFSVTYLLPRFDSLFRPPGRDCPWDHGRRLGLTGQRPGSPMPAGRSRSLFS